MAACPQAEVAERLQQLLMHPTFRVYSSTDITGVELCGAAKNIIALAAGMAEGLGCGDNAKALLMARALVELGALIEAAGGEKSTCFGLAGMGDMIVTCTSVHSRNHRAGVAIGQGAPAAGALGESHAVVEGYYAARSVTELAERLGVLVLNHLREFARHGGLTDAGHILQADFGCAGLNQLVGNVGIILSRVYG